MKTIDRIIWIVIAFANAYLCVSTARVAIQEHFLWSLALIFGISTTYSIGKIIKP